MRGAAHYRKGDNVLAIADYTEAIRLEPSDVELYVLRAAAYDKTGNRKQAEADRVHAGKVAK